MELFVDQLRNNLHAHRTNLTKVSRKANSKSSSNVISVLSHRFCTNNFIHSTLFAIKSNSKASNSLKPELFDLRRGFLPSSSTDNQDVISDPPSNRLDGLIRLVIVVNCKLKLID